MSRAALQTQNDNEVLFFFLKKEREKGTEAGGTVPLTNFSLALFPDLKFLARLARFGAGEKKRVLGSRGAAEGPELAAPWASCIMGG